MGYRIRKNASLETVAKAARHRANLAAKEWRQKVKNEKQASPAEHTYRRWITGDAYSKWSDLNEIASHLERLAGLPINDGMPHPKGDL